MNDVSNKSPFEILDQLTGKNNKTEDKTPTVKQSTEAG